MTYIKFIKGVIAIKNEINKGDDLLFTYIYIHPYESSNNTFNNNWL